MKLYEYQQEAVDDLANGKKIVVAKTGLGKTAMMMTWLKSTGRKKVLIVTTPSKRDSGDMEVEADMWCGKEWRTSLSSFIVVSWHGLAKWWQEEIATKYYGKEAFSREWAVGFDEVAKAGAGISSRMGTTFLQMTNANKCWTGYTGTPGDTWIKFYPYFTACGLVKHKTDFQSKYCKIQTWRGFPEIIGYNNEPELKAMWKKISTAPDSSEVDKQLPSERHEVVKFKQPAGYKKFLKDRIHPETKEFVETTMGVCHTARQLCFSKQKREWVKDFIEDLGTNAVFFCNYIEEEDELEKIAKKALPKGARIWRIDGKHHEIPTANTIGDKDIVIAHYASGGEALNLQFMHYWVSVSPNYSYAMSIQARGRIKRIGQKHKCMFYYLKCLNTIEEAVYKCLSAKQDFAEDTWAIAQGIKEE